MKKDDDFISMLIDETFTMTTSSEDVPADEEYFEQQNSNILEFPSKPQEVADVVTHSMVEEIKVLKLLDAIDGVSVFTAAFQENTKCFHFNINGFEFDMPSNWSMFANSNDYLELISFHEFIEETGFSDVFSLVMDIESKHFLAVKNKMKFFLIGFDKSVKYSVIESSMNYLIEECHMNQNIINKKQISDFDQKKLGKNPAFFFMIFRLRDKNL